MWIINIAKNSGYNQFDEYSIQWRHYFRIETDDFWRVPNIRDELMSLYSFPDYQINVYSTTYSRKKLDEEDIEGLRRED